MPSISGIFHNPSIQFLWKKCLDEGNLEFSGLRQGRRHTLRIVVQRPFILKPSGLPTSIPTGAFQHTDMDPLLSPARVKGGCLCWHDGHGTGGGTRHRRPSPPPSKPASLREDRGMLASPAPGADILSGHPHRAIGMLRLVSVTSSRHNACALSLARAW